MADTLTIDELVSVTSDLHAALDDASGVVDAGPDEEYAYQHQLERAKGVLDLYAERCGRRTICVPVVENVTTSSRRGIRALGSTR